MLSIKRTHAKDHDFLQLNKLLDAELALRDGKEHAFYAQYNTVGQIRYILVAYENGIPVACGAIKAYQPGIMEIKRMFTTPENRGKGIAREVLTALEKWTLELGYDRCILETGVKQPEAIRLYKKAGYSQIPNYGQYAGVDNSLCFEKAL